MDYTAIKNTFHYRKCLSESARTKVNEVIPPLLFTSALCANTMQNSYQNFTPTEPDYFDNSVTSYEKSQIHDCQIWTLKQTTHKLERKGHCTYCVYKIFVWSGKYRQ